MSDATPAGAPRLLFVSHSREVGGAERYLLDVIRHVRSARPWSLTLVCRTDAAVDALAAEAAPACEVVRLDVARPRDLVRLRALVHQNDAVHLNLAFPSGKYQLAVALAADLGRRTLVVTHHLALPVPPQWRLFMRRLGRVAFRHIAITEGQRQFLVARFGYPQERVVVVHNGVDTGLFKPSGRPSGGTRPPACVAVARLSPQKGLETLLDAVAEARREVSGLRLNLVGDGPLRDELEARARTLRLDSDMVLERALSRQEVAHRLAAADVYVLSSRYEGSPLALMEAMACGLPSVATDVSGVRDLIPDAALGRVVPVGDVHAMARAIVELLGDPDLRSEIGRRARERILEGFTIERSLRETEHVLAQALEARV